VRPLFPARPGRRDEALPAELSRARRSAPGDEGPLMLTPPPILPGFYDEPRERRALSHAIASRVVPALRVVDDDDRDARREAVAETLAQLAFERVRERATVQSPGGPDRAGGAS
jgi:hypothetical protein